MGGLGTEIDIDFWHEMSKALTPEEKFIAQPRLISDGRKKSFAAIYQDRESPTLLKQAR
jgi:hypothetical protein